MFSGNLWVLVTCAAAALGLFGLSQKFKQGPESQRAGGAPPTQYDSDDVRTLKRLLREVFADLVKVRGRLDELEAATGVPADGDVPADATTLERSSAATRRPATDGREGGQASRLRSAVGGALKLGGGLLWADDEAGSAGVGEVQAAGVRLGTDLVLQLGGAVRDGKDSIVAEVRIDPAEESMSLRKVVYSCRPTAAVRLTLAPFGARGQDAAYTLNPVAGQGLTAAVRHGCPLHQRVLGSMVAASLDLRRAWLSLGVFSQSLEGGGQVDTLLAQAVVAPLRALSLGVSMVEPRAGRAAAPAGQDSNGLAPPGLRRDATPAGLARGAPILAPASSSGRQLGGTAALRIAGGLALHGWATGAASAVGRGLLREAQWGVTLAPQPDGSGNSWAFGAGRVGALAPAAAGALEPNVFELSAQFNLGGGLLLTPGVVVLRQRGRSAVFAGMSTAWQF